MPGRATTIQIPRWIQLVGLQLVGQVVFLFLGMAANRVDDHCTAPDGQPGRSPAAVTR